MKTKSIGFIGGGRITRIFLQGLSNKKALPKTVSVFEPNAETFKTLQTDFNIVTAAGSAAEAATRDIVFIAVHPPVVMETLQAIQDAVAEETVVISLAPKISLEKMASILPSKKLARMIPNATSFINEGYNPIAFHPDMPKEDKKLLNKLLKKLGKTFETDEAKLEGYALISAMLPTYFWFQFQELEKIAQQIGLTPKEASKTIKESVKKSLKTYYNSGLSPAEVMDLIPVKPIGEHETEITEIYQTKLMGLFGKIKP